MASGECRTGCLIGRSANQFQHEPSLFRRNQCGVRKTIVARPPRWSHLLLPDKKESVRNRKRSGFEIGLRAYHHAERQSDHQSPNEPANDALQFSASESIKIWAFQQLGDERSPTGQDRKSTRLNSSHRCISYAVFCLKKKK